MRVKFTCSLDLLTRLLNVRVFSNHSTYFSRFSLASPGELLPESFQYILIILGINICWIIKGLSIKVL